MRPSLFFKLLVAIAGVVASPSANAGSMPWASNDYVDLYFRIYNGHVPLPHLREEKQKALFNHLVDPENLVRIQSASMSGDDKQRELEIILSTLGTYRARYDNAVVVGEPLEQELALVQAYELQVMGCMARLLPSGTATGVSHPAWITLIGGVIGSVENHQTYSPRQNAIMAEAIARNYPTIAAALSTHERDLVRAEALKFDESDTNSIRRQAREQVRRTLLQ
jgi:hypothetical protein